VKSKFVILLAREGIVRLVGGGSIGTARLFDSWVDASQWILAHACNDLTYQVVELTHTINPAVVHDCCRNPVCQGHAANCAYAPGN